MLTHKGTQELHTARLTLRRFTPEDAQAMYDTWASDERVTRFLTWEPHASADATRQLLEMWCEGYEQPETYNWVMEHQGAPIGNVSVVSTDERSEAGGLGYCMGNAYWSQGLMTEAVCAVRDYLFAEVGYNRLEISHAVLNPASGKVARKCGMTYEGTKRAYFQKRAGEFLDISFYGMLKSDWEERKRG